MAQVKFYRGNQGVSLPEHEDGVILVVGSNTSEKSGIYYGDLYVDVAEGKRLHIKPNEAFSYLTYSEFQEMANVVSASGKVYLCVDYPYSKTYINEHGVTITEIPVPAEETYLAFFVGDGTHTWSQINPKNAVSPTDMDN